MEATPTCSRAGSTTGTTETQPRFPPPPGGGGDAYLLKSVIHDWDDGHATAILANCRQVMPPHGRLLVLEAILPPKISPSREMTGTVLAGDLNMLVSTGGRERTEAEFSSLFEATGFRLSGTSAVPAPAAYLSVIEGIPT